MCTQPFLTKSAMHERIDPRYRADRPAPSSGIDSIDIDNSPAKLRLKRVAIGPILEGHQNHSYYKVDGKGATEYCMAYNDMKNKTTVTYRLWIPDEGLREPSMQMEFLIYPQGVPLCTMPKHVIPISRQDFMLAYHHYLNII